MTHRLRVITVVVLAVVGVGVFMGAGPASAAPTTITTGGSPRLLAMSPDGTTAYLGDSSFAGKVDVIDVATDTVTHVISVGAGPEGIAVSPDGSTVYTANLFDNTVSVIDTATNQVTATITGLGNAPQAVAFTPDGTKAYVANFSGGSVSVIDVATNTVIDTITGISIPRQLVVSADGSQVLVASAGGPSVVTISTATNTITHTITLPTSPWGMALGPDPTKAYATLHNGGIAVLNLTNDTLASTITAGVDTGSIGIAISPDDNYAYVANTDSNDLQVIRLSNGQIIDTVTMPNSPLGVGLTPNGAKLYVADNGAGEVSQLTFPVITSTTLPPMTVGTHYSFTLAAGDPPTFSMAAGALPAGLTLDPATGIISGTPTATGPATFTIATTNEYLATFTHSFSVTVAAATIPPSSVSPSSDADPLAQTGSQILPALSIGLGLVVLGFGFQIGAGRRQRARAT